MRRRHSDVLLAGLILIGAAMWLALVVQHVFDEVDVDFGDAHHVAVLFAGGFCAAQVARRLLVELDTPTTIVASLVAMAVTIGLFAQRRYESVDIDMLIPLGAASAGAWLGALTSRAPAREPAKLWRVLGAGYAAFAAMLVCGGAVLFVTESDGYMVLSALIGGALGALFVAWFAGVRAEHCALGLALVTAIATPAGNGDVWGALAGAVIGWMLGGIGGAVGARIRESRKAAPDLPHAQVR